MMVLTVKGGEARMQAIVAKVRSYGCGWVLVLDETTTYTSNHVPTFWQAEAKAVG